MEASPARTVTETQVRLTWTGLVTVAVTEGRLWGSFEAQRVRSKNPRS